MIINRILNNNVVITIGNNDKEIIVMGKGIGFQKSKGDKIDEEKINKIFKLADEEIVGKLQEILNNIPIEYMKIADEIIEYSQKKLNKKLNENIYLSLGDHIYTAAQRIKNGIIVKNALLWEIKRFYKDEFEIGLKALCIIKEKTNIELPEDEAGFIAFHIVNAQLNTQQPMVENITKLIQEISTIVRIHFGVEFKESSVFYYRFITHLKFFAERLFSNSTYNGDVEQELLAMIISKYSEAYKCILKIKTFTYKKYNYELTDDEMIYLTLHIAKLMQDLKI